MPTDHPHQAVVPTQIIWPTKEQMEKGLAEIERHAPFWKATPALLVIKPHLGVIVSLKNIEHDERHFTLSVAVEETIVAPKGLDAQFPITLKNVWNQPYLSMDSHCISAPYGYYLHFGDEGVQRVRKLSAELSDKQKNGPFTLGLLRGCFQRNLLRSRSSSRDETN